MFLSSIDGVRRLLPMLELLQLKAFPLHSQLQQRQRLKNLDRLISNILTIVNMSTSILTAVFAGLKKFQIQFYLQPM